MTFHLGDTSDEPRGVRLLRGNVRAWRHPEQERAIDALAQPRCHGVEPSLPRGSPLAVPERRDVKAGAVVAVNQALDDDPSLVNSDPYGAGWMILLRVTDESAVGGLMDAAGYQALVGE